MTQVARPAWGKWAATGALAALAAVMDLVQLAHNGYANNFYAAADRSMLDSLHNLLFASFDPGGLVSVDKPPLALWLQVASAKLLGFSAIAILLPQALIGVLSVLALHAIVRRAISPCSALAAGLTFAVFPAFVAVARDNLPDPLMILLMVLACGSLLRSIESGRRRHLMLSAVLIAAAFNTKTLAAYIVLPALGGAYLLCAPGSVARRLGSLLAAGLVLAAVSLSWLTFVDAVPAGQRPYVGGSANNSELGLTFSYNGLGRLRGQEGATGRIPYRPGAALEITSGPQEPADQAIYPALGRGLAKLHSEPGAAGPLRLFNAALGGQGAWLLPLAIVSLLWMLGERLLSLRRREIDRGDMLLATLVVFGGWLACEAIVLSFAGGIIHPYYVSAIAPGLAVMVGLGCLRMVVALRLRERAATLALAAGIEATIAVQALLLVRADYAPALAGLLIAVGGLLALLILAALLAPRALAELRRRTGTLWPRRLTAQGLSGRAFAVAALTGLLLIAPTIWSATTWLAPVQGTFPAAGPHAAAGPGGIGLYPEELPVFRRLAAYLRRHQASRRFAILTVSSVTAAPMILMGVHAAALAGYGGVDPALDARSLARLTARGQARYVLLGGAYSERGGNGATAATLRACALLPQSAWGGGQLEPYALTLFDCRGRALALAGKHLRR